MVGTIKCTLHLHLSKNSLHPLLGKCTTNCTPEGSVWEKELYLRLRIGTKILHQRSKMIVARISSGFYFLAWLNKFPLVELFCLRFRPYLCASSEESGEHCSNKAPQVFSGESRLKG